MPEYPVYTLLFILPDNFDKLSRQEKGRVFIHMFIEHAKKKYPALSTITGEYTGSGDSFEDAHWIFYGEHPDGSPDTSIFQLVLHPDVAGALEYFLVEWVNDEHPGWENNDGGFGNMQIDLVKRSITMEHNEREVVSNLAGSYTLFDDSVDGSGNTDETPAG